MQANITMDPLDVMRNIRKHVISAWLGLGAQQYAASGVATPEDGIVLFIGGSGSGKTTMMVNWLLEGHHNFFCNDTAWIFPSGLVTGLPKAICYRENLSNILGKSDSEYDDRDGLLRWKLRPEILAKRLGVGITRSGRLENVIRLQSDSGDTDHERK